MYKNYDTNRHHRKPKSKGGKGNRKNIVRVNVKEHQAYHVLFRNMQPHEIADVLNHTWIDPKYIFTVRRRK